MTRNARQNKILSLISACSVETQEELRVLLREQGFAVTQATVSRDIRELGLVKTATEVGTYRYATKQDVGSNVSGRLLGVLRDNVVSLQTAENLIVVKTIADCACQVATAVEQCAFAEVVGVVADRATVLVVCVSSAAAQLVSDKINNL